MSPQRAGAFAQLQKICTFESLHNICNKYKAEDLGRNDANTIKRPVLDERSQTKPKFEESAKRGFES